jgi:hypothetical protein
MWEGVTAGDRQKSFCAFSRAASLSPTPLGHKEDAEAPSPHGNPHISDPWLLFSTEPRFWVRIPQGSDRAGSDSAGTHYFRTYHVPVHKLRKR